LPTGRGPLSSNDPCSQGGEPRGAHLARDGDGSLGDQGGDDDGDGDEDDVDLGPGPLTAVDDGKKKKKRKPRKKKKKGTAAATQQSSPPRVPLSDLFTSGEYPVGELLSYADDVNTARTTTEELRYLGRQHIENPAFLNDYRKAAEVHRQVRQWVQDTVKPGHTLLDIATGVEDGVRALLGHQGIEPGDFLKGGMGFPTGLCLNHQTAHYTPNPGQKDVVLQYQDVMKVDFGVHINGWIVDSAFTMSFDPVYDNLLDAVKDATNSGIKVGSIPPLYLAQTLTALADGRH
jgi:methionyl aminopeptidase